MWFTDNFKDYSVNGLQKDIIAGLTVGFVSIPLGMAFAIASGVKPEYGIYTSIIAGIIISLSGGSKFQVSGPTGAFIPVLFAIVMQYGYGNLLLAGFMAGIILVLMGIFKLGALIKFIPRPVTIGFTSGIAVLIFSGQIANFLGLRNVEKHEDFFSNMVEIFKHLDTMNFYSIIIGLTALAIIIILPKITTKIPGAIIGLIVSSIISFIFFEGQVMTIGSTFGEIPSSLPSFHLFDISIERIKILLGPAFTIAILGSIESLLSAVVADGMTASNHNSNRELIGQGIGNMVIPLFGGLPATGAIARTATNIKSGAVSPIAAVVHSLTVLLVLLIFAPYASHVPLASIAPILMVVAWNMSERKQFVHVLKTKIGDAVVLIITFSLTLLTSLTTAVEFGLLFAVILFVKRMSDVMTVAKVLPDHLSKHEKLVPNMVSDGHDCPQVSIYTIEGPLFFGAAGLFTETIMNAINYKPKILLLQMSRVPFMDTTGESNLNSIVKHFKKNDGIVLISGIKHQPLEVLKHSGLQQVIGEENFFEDVEKALNFGLTKLDKEICFGCENFAFRECALLSKEVKIIDDVNVAMAGNN